MILKIHWMIIITGVMFAGILKYKAQYLFQGLKLRFKVLDNVQLICCLNFERTDLLC